MSIPMFFPFLTFSYPTIQRGPYSPDGDLIVIDNHHKSENVATYGNQTTGKRCVDAVYRSID
jgi:hypothetical protein